MTSSGVCHVCGIPCFEFHYNKAYSENGQHDGYWHCCDHGHKSAEGTAIVEEQKAKDPMFGMNRAERRFYKRKHRELNN